MYFLFVHQTAGWYGFRLSPRIYLYVRDARRHPLRFSERHWTSRRRILLAVGPWSLWLYTGEVAP